MKKSKHKPGDLRVWWVPQVPMKAFCVPVDSVAMGAKLLSVLADYDIFQFENKIKPDYCNAGGLQRWCPDSDGEGSPGWEDWYDEESGEDDPEEVRFKGEHMKPPDLTDDAAMLLRGRRSAIRSIRDEHMIALRDAYTHLQSADYDELVAGADAVIAAAEQLKTVAALWQEFGA